MKIDDVGSLPLPGDVSLGELNSALSKEEIPDWTLNLMDEMMKMKWDAGVEAPCYPQMRPMIDQFVSLLKDEEKCRERYLLREDVRLPELRVMDSIDHKCKKACLSGPFELSLEEFGEPRGAEMKRIGESLRVMARDEGLEVVSIDEPSLGIREPYRFETDDLLEAWNEVCEVDATVEIHLHSLYFQELVCKSDIEVIDFPIAENLRNLKLVNEGMLGDYGMKARVGVSRTNPSSETDVTSPEDVAENLAKAEEVLGEMLEYTGPDCGLGGLDSIELAERVLRLTVDGVKLYRDRKSS